MDWVEKFIKMGQFMWVNFFKDNLMEMVNIQTLMVIIMREIGSKVNGMEKENMFISMGKYQKVNGNRVFFKINKTKIKFR